MKKNRSLYLHEDTNGGKLAALDALHTEYRRYLQACVDHMILHRRMVVPRGEKLRFFPNEKILNTNITGSCQDHAVGIVKGWVSSRYVTKLRSRIHNQWKLGCIDTSTKIQLHTIGKYLVDKSGSIAEEVLAAFWDMLLEAGKTPHVGKRVPIQCTVHTANFTFTEDTSLSRWWVRFSHLDKGKKIQLPLKANPHVKKPDDLVKGIFLKKDRHGRWRMDAVERRESPAIPRYDEKAARVGIDVGLNVIAATSDGRLYGADQKPKFDALKFKVDQLRKNRQRQGLRENSKRLDILEDRLSGFIKTLTGTVANKLVKSYVNHTFVLEDLNLSGCRGSKRFSYRALANALSRKAACLAVNPAYTSQECPSCGYISRSNRAGTKFHCRGCGRLSHADVIGAQNILGRSYDQSISCDDDPSDVKAVLQRRFSEKRRRPEDQPEVNELVSSSRELTVGLKPKRRTRIAPNAREIPNFFRKD